ncbi:hypothetical protein AMST5_02803 [freshwater sediment metagenome]|uniref:Uncharacterized protein n=1 Tax=freshwater sediment metagenome TaxID=556182 RepID=A0AA48M0U8_9ZZZZ
MTDEGIISGMSEMDVSMCLDLIREIASQPRVALAESVDAGVARNLDALAMALGWTAEEVAAAWARITAIADESKKRGWQ